MKPLIIFDLDGTLVDSKKDIALSLNYALEKEGFEALPQKQIEDLVGWGAKQLVRQALGSPKEEALGRVFMSFWNHYDQHLLDNTALYPHAELFLNSFPGWQKAVVTNKPQLFTDKILAGLNIRNYFQWVIGGDHLPVQKPNPEVFSPIERELGGFSKTIMIGDSVVDIQCGKAAGFFTCALTHGFGLQEELESFKPDYLVHSFADLKELPIFLDSAPPEVGI